MRDLNATRLELERMTEAGSTIDASYYTALLGNAKLACSQRKDELTKEPKTT
jgi:hypothetical protein